jgi:hypothetical protein
MNRSFYIIFILLSFLISCEKVIEFDVETTTPKIVINSIFNTDDNWNVHLSSSLSVIDTSNLSNIEDASVYIFDDQNQIIETLVHDSLGFYQGILKPIDGLKYKIEASALNFETVNAIDSIPQKSTITGLDTSSFVFNGNERISISIGFNQSISISNYYKIAVKIGREKYSTTLDQNGFNIVDTNYKEKWINVRPESSFAERTSNPKEIIFKDNTFSSNEESVSFSIKNLINKHYEDDSYSLKFITIYFFGISHDHYKYYNSLKTYEDNSSNIFAQPVQVYSNVNNGFGVFAGSTCTKIELF